MLQQQFALPVTPTAATWNNVMTLVKAQGYDGTSHATALYIKDPTGVTEIKTSTDGVTTPTGTTGETIGTTGATKEVVWESGNTVIDLNCLWVYQAAAHAISIRFSSK